MPKLFAAALFTGVFLDTQALQVDVEAKLGAMRVDARLEAMRVDTSYYADEAGAMSSAPGNKVTQDVEAGIEESFKEYVFDDVGASNDPGDLQIESASKMAVAHDDGILDTQMVQLTAGVDVEKGTKKADLEEARVDTSAYMDETGAFSPVSGNELELDPFDELDQLEKVHSSGAILSDKPAGLSLVDASAVDKSAAVDKSSAVDKSQAVDKSVAEDKSQAVDKSQADKSQADSNAESATGVSVDAVSMENMEMQSSATNGKILDEVGMENDQQGTDSADPFSNLYLADAAGAKP